ncbi:MAG TPA: methylated-DNA--[protein]-cysteine S-methyltransferase, partial [Candidatus Acidoferrum sp.]|nr:methylated-DNA--[protein]-cysteine S-methyltransferase [Candidatus Acidoferrum sp.]
PETPLLKEAARQFEAYFAGVLKEFDLPLAISGPPFFAAILKELPKLVPYGETASYGEVADMFGSPGASRAVGSAMKKNPFVIVVPCHRVTKAGGVLGCYSAGGEGNKRLLLKLEGSLKE